MCYQSVSISIHTALTSKKMPRVPSNAVLMEQALGKQLSYIGIKNTNCNTSHRRKTSIPSVQASSVGISGDHSIALPRSAVFVSQRADQIKVCAMRRRRVHQRSDTYVLLEPGQDEKFVSEEELKAKLKDYLENWPMKSLPPDLARFESIDEAASFLVNSVCELEIDGDVGSVQWYEVRLE